MSKELIELLRTICTETEIQNYIKVSIYVKAIEKDGKEIADMLAFYKDAFGTPFSTAASEIKVPVMRRVD